MELLWASSWSWAVCRLGWACFNCEPQVADPRPIVESDSGLPSVNQKTYQLMLVFQHNSTIGTPFHYNPGSEGHSEITRIYCFLAHCGCGNCLAMSSLKKFKPACMYINIIYTTVNSIVSPLKPHSWLGCSRWGFSEWLAETQGGTSWRGYPKHERRLECWHNSCRTLSNYEYSAFPLCHLYNVFTQGLHLPQSPVPIFQANPCRSTDPEELEAAKPPMQDQNDGHVPAEPWLHGYLHAGSHSGEIKFCSSMISWFLY